MGHIGLHRDAGIPLRKYIYIYMYTERFKMEWVVVAVAAILEGLLQVGP